MDTPKNKPALIAGIAVAAIVTTAALAMAAWPALTRPDPPVEATGDGGLRIRVVETPKAVARSTSPISRLDVGLSEAAKAMAKGREALFVRTPPVQDTPPPAPRYAPARVAQVDDQDDLPPQAERIDDRWDRRPVEAGYELAQQRWEEERQAQREQDRRMAWEQERREQRRWEAARYREREDERRYDDRYAPAPPPDMDDAPPPGRW